MALGARSLRGAMGTYAWTALAAVLALALVLWLGPWDGQPRATVTLDPDGPWSEGALDDGLRVWELRPGEPLELPPGPYRVTLFGPAGAELRAELELGDAPLRLGGADGVSDTAGSDLEDQAGGTGAGGVSADPGATR